MLNEAVLALAVVTVLAYCLECLSRALDDPREPPRLTPRVPIIGHALGFLRRGFDYYMLTNQAANTGIYTLGCLTSKVYIAHDPRVANLIAKSEAISLRPFLRHSGKLHGTISDEAYALLDGDLADYFSKRTKELLTPGPALDAQNLRMAQQSLDEVSKLVNQEPTIELFEWSKRTVMLATGASLFGAEHPFQNPRIAEAMWAWDEARPGHIFGFDPWGTGYKARKTVLAAFKEYFENIPDDASGVIKERHRVLREGGLSEEDTYKLQSTLSNAYFNTIPTLFWTIHDTYCRPELLAGIRQEVSSKAVQRSSGADHGFVLDIAALQTQCHILLSAFQETQRTRHAQVGMRMVIEDTLIDGKYLLKKGTPLHVPAKSIHRDPSIWGSDATEYDPYRFVPAHATGEPKAKIMPTAFLPWGAAPWLCPARQFAATEILILWPCWRYGWT
ncbi:cytochrome P450 [Aspergillus aurantiobrunneus]